MRNTLSIILILLLQLSVYGQQDSLKLKLYKLEREIILGNSESLREMAFYLDDTTSILEFLGYHRYPNSARGIAMRVLSENCLVEDEFRFDSTLSAQKILKLVNENKLNYDDLTGMFISAPLSKRKISYKLRDVSDYDLKRLDSTINSLPHPDWYFENQIDLFIANKDPQALLWTASAWYKKRSRFNSYYFNDEEFLDLIKFFTKMDLGVTDDLGNITFLYKDDFYAHARLNFLTYWIQHYKDYKWDDNKRYFINFFESSSAKSKEETLFELLASDNDSIAIASFTQLTEMDTGNVKALSKAYQKNRVDVNYKLPTFPFKFLQQIVSLTQYCRDNNIDYKLSGWLLDSINKLKAEMPFIDRYRLENNLINKLTLDDLTKVEYFGLINQQEWDLSYSLGRILDKTYSRNWVGLTKNKKLLSLYLKKSKLFDDIGIIGNLNKYLRKFENCSNAAIEQAKQIAHTTNDSTIKQQAFKVISLYSKPIAYTLEDPNSWEGNKEKYGVKNLQRKYRKIISKKQETDEKESAVKELIGEINYNQIENAIQILKRDTLLGDYEKFSFLESDFGFPINPEDSMARGEFLSYYKAKNQYELYELYLTKNGISFMDNNGQFLHLNIYEILKYDVVDAFVGGGGGRRDNCVYLLIKLLELKFKTRLGYSEKLCSSQGIYSCDCTDQAKAWMHFLEERKLVSPDKTEPPSISPNK